MDDFTWGMGMGMGMGIDEDDLNDKLEPVDALEMLEAPLQPLQPPPLAEPQPPQQLQLQQIQQQQLLQQQQRMQLFHQQQQQQSGMGMQGGMPMPLQHQQHPQQFQQQQQLMGGAALGLQQAGQQGQFPAGMGIGGMGLSPASLAAGSMGAGDAFSPASMQQQQQPMQRSMGPAVTTGHIPFGGSAALTPAPPQGPNGFPLGYTGYTNQGHGLGTGQGLAAPGLAPGAVMPSFLPPGPDMASLAGYMPSAREHALQRSREMVMACGLQLPLALPSGEGAGGMDIAFCGTPSPARLLSPSCCYLDLKHTTRLPLVQPHADPLLLIALFVFAGMSVQEVGVLEPRLPGYHTQGQLFPVGYRAVREVGPTKEEGLSQPHGGSSLLVSSTARGPLGPLFRVSIIAPGAWCSQWTGTEGIQGTGCNRSFVVRRMQEAAVH